MDNDTHTYDDEVEMTREEAIKELMGEGYSRDEATRMIGDYEADEWDDTEQEETWFDEIADFVDPSGDSEDFE